MDRVAEPRKVCERSYKTTECITSVVTLLELFFHMMYALRQTNLCERGKQYKSSSWNQSGKMSVDMEGGAIEMRGRHEKLHTHR